MTAPSARTGYALVSLSAISWGTWSLFLRAAESRGPLSAALESLIVMLIIALGILPFALRDTRRYRGPKRTWLPLLVLGGGDAMNILLFFAAMRTSSLAIAVLSHSLAPLLVAALAPFTTGERPRVRTWAAIGAALVGLTLLLEPWRETRVGALPGALLGAGSAVFYAANVLVQKRIAGRFSASEVMSYHAFPSALILALAVPAGGFVIQGQQLAVLGVAGVVLGALAGLAFVRALATIPASHAALVALLEPAVAVLVGVVLWREPMGGLGIAGALMVLAAVVSIAGSRAPAGSAALTRS